MTITEVLGNYRNALSALLPSVEGVNIPWHSAEAYDEWDRLAECLFEVLVEEVLRAGLPVPDREVFQLPPYDTLIESYFDYSLLTLNSHRNDDPLCVFHRFATVEHPFDVVQWRPVTPHGLPLSSKLGETPLETCVFRLRLLTSQRAFKWVDEIPIDSIW